MAFKLLTEKDIQNDWEKYDIFSRSIRLDESEYIFYDGPPFATGLPHYGHILAGFIKDTVARYQTQDSKSVPRSAGWDCHGLPIEYEIEKKHNKKTKQDIFEWGVPNYNSACRDIVMTYASEWETIMGCLGRWIDFKNDYKTLDFDYMNSVWWVFSQLSSKGLIYPSYRVMPYSIACTTPLSNFETQQNYQEIEDITLIIKFKLVNFEESDNVYLLVWTTTPWTLPSNITIAINPAINYSLICYNNNNYIVATTLVGKVFIKKEYTIVKEYIGSELIGIKYHPLFNSYPITTLQDLSKVFTIIGASFVTDTDGTGLVHIAPSYGDDDYHACIQSGIISKSDRLFMSTNEQGFFIHDMTGLEELGGLFYKNINSKDKSDGNNYIIKLLKESDRIFLQSKYKHSYPFCWRSDTPLMYRAIKSWFVNVEVLRDRMVELNKTINWIPSNIGTGRFHNWLANAKDWCIARNRYWGTPIPVWANIEDESDYIIIQSGNQLESLCGLEQNTIKDLHIDKIDHLTFEKNGKTYHRISEVFDCWFESGSMPYASIGYPYKTQKINIPADFIAEGIDQTRGWFYTLLVISTALFDIAPFKNVIVNGLILASDGKKMSKRLQNYPDPMEVVNKYSSDALRLYLLSSNATKGESLKFNESGVFSMAKDIIIPLKNSLSFYLEYEYKFKLENPDEQLYTNEDFKTNNILDMYAIKYIGKLINSISENLSNYLLAEAVRKVIYIVELLNNIYIKFNRHSLKGNNPNWKSSLSTLGLLLKYLTINIAPIAPFLAEYLFKNLSMSGDSVHLSKFKDTKYHLPILSDENTKNANDMTHIINTIKQVLIVRSKNSISMKIPIGNLIIKTSSELLELIKSHSNFILDELNILDIQIEVFEWKDIQIEIRPNFPIIKQTYSNVEVIKQKILTINRDRSLKQFLIENKNIMLDGFIIEPSMVEIIIKPESIDNYVSQYSFIDGYNYCVYINTEQTEQIKILAYAKLIATLFQRMRKNAGLHPWDPINLGIYGETEYEFDKIMATIEKTCSIKPTKLDKSITQFIFEFKMSEYTEDPTNNLIMYLF